MFRKIINQFRNVFAILQLDENELKLLAQFLRNIKIKIKK